MKRLISVMKSILMRASAAGGKYKAMPDIFAVTVESMEREVYDSHSFVYKEYLKTANKSVNAELKAIVDGYDKKLSPALQDDVEKSGSQTNRLDVNIIYYRTGDRFISTMVQARSCRKLLSLDMTTRTFDLATGQRLYLTDLFDESSTAWRLIEDGVREHMKSVYSGEKRDEAAIETLCVRKKLEVADFTLSGMELTLHYPAKSIFENKTNLIHVRFYYPQLYGMMTQTGIEATDNRRWKMVAITCDDGPKDLTTCVLDAFRKVGARVTYFIVGKQLPAYSNVFIKEFDQNHTFGSHTYNHCRDYTSMMSKCRIREIDMTAELTLSLVGVKAECFRPPCGKYSPWVESNISMPIIRWSLDTFDYTGNSAQRIFYSIRKDAKEYDIILCHDTSDHLHEAIPLIAKYFESHGYMMVTLEELCAAQGMIPEDNVVYWSFRPGENSNDRQAIDRNRSKLKVFLKGVICMLGLQNIYLRLRNKKDVYYE